MIKSLAALAALVLTFAAAAVPAGARDAYVIDNAHLLSAAAVAQINAKVADFSALTHKEILVDTESAIDGTPQAAAERIMAQQRINGVLIFVAKSPKTIGVVPDRAAQAFFPAGTTAAIRQAIASAFNSGNFDAGINNGVDLTLSQYRSHMGSLRTHANAPVAVPAPSVATGGFQMGWIWWLIVLAVIFFVIRGIFRAMAGPRMYPPGYGQPGMGGGPGYGPGYGGGGFGGGGGGGFWSGMLGGLGGAFLGNELFGNRGGFGGGGEAGGGNYAGMGDAGNQADAGGWQSDAGQADMGNASFGGFGDSGGDSGGGWGGGGGGDFGGGGGGGDSGGGW